MVIPFVVEGWHAPAGRRSRETPGLLPRPGRSGTAPPVGATKPGIPADRSYRRTTSGVSRIEGQAGTQATDPTPRPGQNLGSRTGTINPHPPCRLRMSVRLVGYRCLCGSDHPFCRVPPRPHPGLGARGHRWVSRLRALVPGWPAGNVPAREKGNRGGLWNPRARYGSRAGWLNAPRKRPPSTASGHQAKITSDAGKGSSVRNCWDECDPLPPVRYRPRSGCRAGHPRLARPPALLSGEVISPWCWWPSGPVAGLGQDGS